MHDNLLAGLIVATISLVLGIGIGGAIALRTEPIQRAENCAPCPVQLQLQCVRDSWSHDYVAGKCGTKKNNNDK